MLDHVCVYCSSSNHVEKVYFEVAEQTGRRLAEGGYTLVYGGGNVGLMGALARSVHAHGGQVVGVIPEALKAKISPSGSTPPACSLVVIPGSE